MATRGTRRRKNRPRKRGRGARAMQNDDVKEAVADARKTKDDAATAKFVKGDVVGGDVQPDPPAPVKESDGNPDSDPEQ